MEKILRCNQCERVIKQENGLLREDVFEGKKEWGYFSKKDFEIHHFILCEQCYDAWIHNFAIPVEVTEKKEI